MGEGHPAVVGCYLSYNETTQNNSSSTQEILTEISALRFQLYLTRFPVTSFGWFCDFVCKTNSQHWWYSRLPTVVSLANIPTSSARNCVSGLGRVEELDVHWASGLFALSSREILRQRRVTPEEECNPRRATTGRSNVRLRQPKKSVCLPRTTAAHNPLYWLTKICYLYKPNSRNTIYKLDTTAWLNLLTHKPAHS